MDKNSYEHTLRVAKYIMQMRPVFNVQALFSDETRQYVQPMEPACGEMVTIRPGDSLYFDSGNPHGMKAIGGKPAKVLIVVI